MATPIAKNPSQRGGLSTKMRRIDVQFFFTIVLSFLFLAKSFNRLNSLPYTAHLRTALSMSTLTAQTYDEHFNFIRNVAKADPPKKLDLLLELVVHQESVQVELDLHPN